MWGFVAPVTFQIWIYLEYGHARKLKLKRGFTSSVVYNLNFTCLMSGLWKPVFMLLWWCRNLLLWWCNTDISLLLSETAVRRQIRDNMPHWQPADLYSVCVCVMCVRKRIQNVRNVYQSNTSCRRRCVCSHQMWSNGAYQSSWLLSGCYSKRIKKGKFKTINQPRHDSIIKPKHNYCYIHLQWPPAPHSHSNT